MSPALEAALAQDYVERTRLRDAQQQAFADGVSFMLGRHPLPSYMLSPPMPWPASVLRCGCPAGGCQMSCPCPCHLGNDMTIALR